VAIALHNINNVDDYSIKHNQNLEDKLMKLVAPCWQYHASFIAYLESLGDEERYPFTLDLDSRDFAQYLQVLENYANGVALPEKTAQNSTLWLVEDGEIIGVTNIRHYLNEYIEHCGGHIGLGIKPSSRGQGYGSKLMGLSIEYLAQLGVKSAHVHCYKNNISSAKAIIANGGSLDSEIIENNQIIQRYIVDTSAYI